MFEDMYTKSNSIAKNLLACVSVLFLMAGCGAYDVSKSNNDNNAMTKSIRKPNPLAIKNLGTRFILRTTI